MDVKKLAADILGTTRRVRTSEQGESGMTEDSNEGGDGGDEARNQQGDKDVMKVSLCFRWEILEPKPKNIRTSCNPSICG